MVECRCGRRLNVNRECVCVNYNHFFLSIRILLLHFYLPNEWDELCGYLLWDYRNVEVIYYSIYSTSPLLVLLFRWIISKSGLIIRKMSANCIVHFETRSSARFFPAVYSLSLSSAVILKNPAPLIKLLIISLSSRRL